MANFVTGPSTITSLTDRRVFINNNVIFGSPVSVGSSNAQGVLNSFSRSDHVHQGVHSVNANGGAQDSGDISLVNGSICRLPMSGAGTFTFNVPTGAGGVSGIKETGGPTEIGLITLNPGTNLTIVDSPAGTFTFNVPTGAGGVITITGNSGPALSGNVSIITANTNVNFVGAGTTLTLDFGASSNLALGSSLSALTSGTNNVGIGFGTLSSLTERVGKYCNRLSSGTN